MTGPIAVADCRSSNISYTFGRKGLLKRICMICFKAYIIFSEVIFMLKFEILAALPLEGLALDNLLELKKPVLILYLEQTSSYCGL